MKSEEIFKGMFLVAHMTATKQFENTVNRIVLQKTRIVYKKPTNKSRETNY